MPTLAGVQNETLNPPMRPSDRETRCCMLACCPTTLEPPASQLLSPNAAGCRGGRSLASLPALVVAFLPKFTCPLCLPLYSSLLSLMGLEFLKEERNLLFFTAAILLLALVNLAIQGRRCGNYLPVCMATVGATVFLGAKFAFDCPFFTYAGLLILMVGCLSASFHVPRLLSRLRSLVEKGVLRHRLGPQHP